MASAGRVKIYYGPIGQTQQILEGDVFAGYFGESVALVDLQEDGRAELVVGAPGVASDKGEVCVYRWMPSTPPSLLPHRVVTGIIPSARLGSKLEVAGDIDGDGVDDVLVGGDSIGDCHVWVWSLAPTTPVQLHSFVGASGERLGRSFAPAGDLDGDDHDDFVIGAVEGGSLTTPGGFYRFVSGADGSEFFTYRNPSGRFGLSATKLGDLDDDGRTEFALHDNLTDEVDILTLRNDSYPGSGEDLRLDVAVAGQVASAWPQKTVSAGATVDLLLDSPNGDYIQEVPVLVADMFVNDQAPIGPTAFPEVHVGTFTSIFTLNGATVAPFFPLRIPAGGLSLSITIPLTASGDRFILQGVALAPSAMTGNGFFTTTDAIEVAVF